MISIVVPVYKVEEYLKRCVDSILNQTFKDYELILVDDGSPDNCPEMCDDYCKKDSRIHVIHKKNGGLSDARNVGIDWCFENSDSQWITFIDSDDWIHPKYLEALYEAANKYNSPISVCDYVDVEGITPFVSYYEIKSEEIDIDKLFLNHNTTATIACCKLYKKDYFTKERYPYGKINEDEYVTYKLLFRNKKIAFVNLPLYFYFNNNESITKVKWSVKNLDAIEALGQQFAFFKKYGNREIFVFVVKKYIWVLRTQYDNLISCDNYSEKDKFIKLIRKELRKCLRQRGVNLPIQKNTHLYSIAYPRLINIFYFSKRLRKKLNRMFNK